MSAKSCVVYCRVSSEGQATDETIDAQRARCAAIVARHGLTVVRHVEDDGRSGTLLGERNFAKLIEDLRRGRLKVDHLVVYNLSRISRTDTTSDDSEKQILSAQDAATIATVLRIAGVTVIDEGGIKAPGSLAYTLEQEIGNQQHSQIIRTTRIGRLHRLDKGEAAYGGKLLYGYRRVEDEAGGWRIEVDEKKMVNLLRIIDWYADFGVTEACRLAEAAKIPVPREKKRKKRASKDWTPYRWGRRTIDLIVDKLDLYLAGETVREFYGQPYKTTFPALQLDPELRARIALRRKAGVLKAPAKRLGTGYVLCADCGGGLHYMPGRVHYLRCDQCKRAVAADRFDASLKAAVDWRLVQIEIHQNVERKRESHAEKISALERQIGQYTADLNTLYEDRLAKRLAADIWATQNQKVTDARTAAEMELAALRLEIQRAETSEGQRRNVTGQIREIIDMTLDGGLPEWRKAVAAVTVGERITLSWSKVEKKTVATVTLPAWGTLAPMVYRTDRPVGAQVRTDKDTTSPQWREVVEAMISHRVEDILDRAGIDPSLADRIAKLVERTKVAEAKLEKL